MSQFQLIAACAFGLEAVVKRELLNLGYESSVASPGRIQFSGDWQAVCRTNLWLRTADRVLILVKRFPAADFDQLFETIKAIEWQELLPVNAEFPVSGKSRKSQLTSVPAVQRATKKAIVESLTRGYGASLPEDGDRYRIEIALLNDEATVTIDTTGPSLHKRGYRQLVGEAPLKETLAAAMIQLSFWRPERQLIDPFCGSGTIPVEAALIAKNIAPGLYREFDAMRWSNFESRAWQDAKDQALDLIVKDDSSIQRILGTDKDPEALKLSRFHAHKAGVTDLIHFQQRDFSELRSKQEFGCVIANPPYGERLNNLPDVKSLYQTFPAVLARLSTWSHFILTSYPNFQKLIQKSADRRRKLYNGRIECIYFQFHGPRPPKEPRPAPEQPQATEQPQAAGPADQLTKPKPAQELKPVFGGLDTKADEQAQLFAARLTKRARHLRRWPTRQGITCFRLYERDIPEIPLVVDRYEDHLHIAEFERPSDRDLGQQANWLELMASTAARTLEIDRRRVFVKNRHRQRGTTQYEKLSKESNRFHVSEGGLKFIVNLSDYLDTGLFLDHRNTRQMVRQQASGKKFLNLFAYTGSFSAYAADGGAESTMTVDWNRNYLNWARDNLALNGFEGLQHQLHCGDSIEFLDNLGEHIRFDLAVVDPPTFSNRKQAEAVWDIQRDHTALLNKLVTKMSPGATVYFSTNFRRFKLTESELKFARITEVTRQTIPDDFRNKRIHRCWKLIVPE